MNFSHWAIAWKEPKLLKNDVGAVQQRPHEDEDAAKKKLQLHRQSRCPHLVPNAAAAAAVVVAAAAAAEEQPG